MIEVLLLAVFVALAGVGVVIGGMVVVEIVRAFTDPWHPYRPWRK